MGEHSAFASEEQAFLLETFLAFQSLMAFAAPTGQDAACGLLVLLAAPPAASQAATRALAARIAGAATLLVCAEEAAAKAAVRSGASDFLVAGATGLDEALRILKNQLRQGSSVGVCLHASPEAIIEACVERGVQPDLLGHAESRLIERGSALITWNTQFAKEHKVGFWTLQSGRLSLMSEFDQIATALVADSDPLRRRWLQAAPAVLGRARQRVRLLPMTASESRIFLSEAQAVAMANGLALHVEQDEQLLRIRMR